MEKITNQAYGEGSYFDAVRARAIEFKEFYLDPRWAPRFYPVLLLTILLGIYTGRKKYIQNAASNLGFVRRVQLWALAAGLGCALAYSLARPMLVPFKPSWSDVLVATAYSWQRPALMLFYSASIVVLAHSARWGKYLAPLAPAGRMPLTNYLMQSVIGTLIFYNYGLGFYNQCGPAVGFGLSTVIYAVQVRWSAWWFERYQYGPAEWLWRALTYGYAPAMRADRMKPRVGAAGA